MKSKLSKSSDGRISLTVHLQPKEAQLIDAAAARAHTTRSDFARNVLLARAAVDAPITACLARLIAIHHRLDRTDLLDAEMRAEIAAAVRELTTAARGEVVE